jgi:predicted RNase H-like nuclease (RuvC/YqgF family)
MSVPSELQPIIKKINKIFDSPYTRRGVFYNPNFSQVPRTMPELSDSEVDKYKRQISDLVDQAARLSRERDNLKISYKSLEEKFISESAKHDKEINALKEEIKKAKEDNPSELKELKDKIKQLENDIECMNL